MSGTDESCGGPILRWAVVEAARCLNANGMPLAIVLTDGQRHDGAIVADVLDDIRVPRLGPGRLRAPAGCGGWR